MKYSQLFTKTRKDIPADETSKNAQLLIQAGFVHKEMAGVYSYLPLGLKVLNKIADIVREEMDAIGGQEILMTALQVKDRYEMTNRWDDKVVDNWFKTKLANGTEMGLGFSHEENVVPIMKNYINSYKDMPRAVYQIQTKFRNELRSKSGIMRGREFLMKDMYSFALSQEEHDEFYKKAQTAYTKIYERFGMGDKTFMTFASGGSFSKYSHEFQTLSEAGEDTIYLDRKKNVAINKEVLTPGILEELQIKREQLEEVRAIEVGNIFGLGTKFSKPFNLEVTDKNGVAKPVIMGCYGIGISRVMGTVAELSSDDRGLFWPDNIAPFRVYLIAIGDSQEVTEQSENLYKTLTEQGVEVLYDDREARPGEKFADADLIGIPHRVVISQKTIDSKSVEYKPRTSDKNELISTQELLKKLT